MTRPRVLAITSRADTGGGPEHLYRLTEALAEEFEVTIAAPRDEPYHRRYCELVGPENVIEIPHRKFRVSTALKLARLCRARRIDIVHSHGKGAGLYSRPVGLVTRTQVVHTFHGLHVGEYGPAAKFLYLMLERLLGAMTSAVIAVSPGERAALVDARVARSQRIHVVINGVVVPDEFPTRRSSDTFTLVAVSRFDHQKNPDLLMDIARSLPGRPDQSYTLNVLGTGERLDECRTKATKIDTGNTVTLVGAVDDVRPWFAEADAFLSTSRWEGLPLAVLEAMSEGLPIVATDVIGNRDAVTDGAEGLLFPSESARDAVDAIVSLALDQAVAETMGKRAWFRASNEFSVDRMAQSTAELYRNALNETNRERQGEETSL